MIKKLKENILEKKIIEKNDEIVVAVSGGPDSVAMLHALCSLREEFNLTLYVCHLNHMLRGAAAEGDAKHVKDLAKTLGVEAFVFSEDVEALAKQMKMSFEETAREARYRLFNYVMQKTGANKVAVGQNMNDQAETFLMRLFRGAGLEGLTAIKFKRDHFIRPLLNIERQDIEAYCLKHQLKTRTDQTNYETTYTRNKIRLEMLPYIQEHFNEKVVKRLYDTSQLLNEDLEYIQLAVDEAFEKNVSQGKQLQMALKSFDGMHTAIKSRLIRKMIQYFLGDLKGVHYQHVISIVKMIEQNNHGSCILIREAVKLEISYDKLVVYPINQEKGLKKQVFEVGDTVSFMGSTFRALSLPYSDRSKNSITIDMDKIKGQLYLRTRSVGDRFSPIGMSGSKKLSDFFINEKIPSAERDDVLLLCDDEQIIWVVGYRMSELYKLDGQTTERLTFVYEKNID